jgi:diketogulonate reductase-like aldo/keto reductase
MLTDHSTVQEVAKRLGVTPAQVLATYRGYSVILKSINFKLIKLSKSDYEEITEIGKGNHIRSVTSVCVECAECQYRNRPDTTSLTTTI